jgi:hypothetical protein
MESAFNCPNQEPVRNQPDRSKRCSDHSNVALPRKSFDRTFVVRKHDRFGGFDPLGLEPRWLLGQHLNPSSLPPNWQQTGEGELTGEAWLWTRWKSVTKLAGGAGTVTSEDKLTERGLTAKKTFTGPDGKVAFRFDEALAPISPKTYEVLYMRLAPAEKK